MSRQDYSHKARQKKTRIADHEFIPRTKYVDGMTLKDWSYCGHVIDYNNNSSTGDIDYCNKPPHDHLYVKENA